jgi:type IV secretory pathway VirB10-like protein
MRKILLALLIVAVVGLLLFGCAPKPATPKTTKLVSTPVAAKEPVAPAAEPAAPEVQEEPVAEPSPAPAEAEPATTKTASVPVTQEELDQLKQGIQGIETEDLGGLSQ